MQTCVPTKELMIGNLPDDNQASVVHDLFKSVGRVLSVAFVARGFAFVEMTEEDASRALRDLKGARLNGRVILLDEAHPRPRSRWE